MRALRRAGIFADIVAGGTKLVSTTADTDSGVTEWTSAAVGSAGVERKVTTTSNGASYASYKVYESLQATTNNDPTTDVGTVSKYFGTYWKEVRSVTEYSMFDDIPQQQSQASLSLQSVFLSASIVNGFAVINVDADSLNITVNDPDEGEVYNEDFDLTSDRGIDNWYDFFYEPIVKWKNFAVVDIPPYINATITATLTSTGVAYCGAMVPGQLFTIGDTQYGASFRITDYSQTSYNTDLDRVEYELGSFTNDGDFNIIVPNSRFSTTMQILSSLRQDPVVWIPDADRTGSILFGYFRDVEYLLSGPTVQLLNLRVAGLTS